MSFSCMRLRVTKSTQRGSTFVEHRVLGLCEGRMPKFDTPASEAESSELRKVPRGGQPSLTIASRDFMRGECQSSILQLMKP
jgi:hypothetical protein